MFPCPPAPLWEGLGRAVHHACPHLWCILLSWRRRRSISEAGKPRRLLGWQHIDLSEARGLVLFRVVREGIGITRRLSAEWALQAYRR